ncbi:hypothetical protein VSP20_09405 [Myroides phaeus]|uniref:hypothetical protein n=1 Tax=Myroides phaeus TaxID=702745 RepID=UPI002DBC11BB|nr:hypothetical protein [Myroides phaeus]MEC4117188.1 hypothetical protein [Myroides phaeus]
MKKKITTLFLLAIGAVSYGQEVTPKDGPGIGIGQSLPSQAAMLDIVAANKGVLIPRIELGDLNVFQLEGGANDEGMLVYNKTAVSATDPSKAIPVGFYYWTNVGTPRWELVTSQSVTDKVLERITTIEKSVGVTPGGDGGQKPGVNPGEGGGTVIYRPGAPGEDGKPGAPGQIVIKDETGKDIPIDLADLLKGSQTNTFFKDAMIKKTIKVKNENGVLEDKEIEVKQLYYFGEKAIADWLLIGGNEKKDPMTEMPNDAPGVLQVDISGIVSNNFKEIFNNTETKETIREVLENVKGNVTIVDANAGTGKEPNYIIKVGDGEGGFQDITLNQLETKTRFEKTIGDGTTAVENPANVKLGDDQTKAKGKVIYTYFGEDKDTPYFIDITADMLTVLQENSTVKQEIVKVINNPVDEDGKPIQPGGDGGVVKPADPSNPTEEEKAKAYGNVYYGPIDPKTPNGEDVLYSVDKDGNKHYINITSNIINEITNNQGIIDKIKEVITVKVEPAGDDGIGKGTETGEVVDGKAVMKAQFNAVSVAKGNGSLPYNSEFNATGFKVNDFGRLLSIQILDKGGQLAMNTVTNVTYDNGVLKFKFGVGSMYATLPAGNEFDVILEYVSAK